MTVFFDTSAVVAVHIESSVRRHAVDALAPLTCVSALALTEALALIAKLTDEPILQADLEDALRLQWDRYAVVPVDQRCLDRAAQLLREQPLRLADALQLAAGRSAAATDHVRDVRPGPDPGRALVGLRRRQQLTIRNRPSATQSAGAAGATLRA